MKKNGISRRNFLRLSATVGAGTFLMPDITASTLHKKDVTENTLIPVRMLGKTGVEIPILSMGVMRADNPNVVRAAYQSGIFHFDTAHSYQNGKNEEMIGNFFEGKPRESYFIATKASLPYPLTENSEMDLNEKVDLSLSRLKMEYVDIFYAHGFRGVEEVKDERVMAILQKLKSDGKTRFVGFSTHAHKPDQIHAAVDAGIYDVILVSYNFKLGNLKETQDAIERAAKAGIGIIAMKTMTGGTEDAEGKKKINAEACLKWAWQNEYITTIIPGFTNYDELDVCLAAARNPVLSPEENQYLLALRDREMLFCQQCGRCQEACPEKLPIPDIMRAYMYTYGYKHAQLAKETLLTLNLPETVCAGCITCKVNCPSGFKVGEKIAAITPVRYVADEFLT